MASGGSWRVVEAAVVNASPLIFLSKAGLLDFLRLVAPCVLVPEPVAQEIGRRGPNDVTARALLETAWLKTTVVEAVPVLIQSWDLGAGESSVLALAHANPGMIAIIDDGAGRRCAEMLGVPLSGTLGLVLLARQRGLIPAARPVIAILKQHGMYLAERTIDRALALVGE